MKPDKMSSHAAMRENIEEAYVYVKNNINRFYMTMHVSIIVMID